MPTEENAAARLGLLLKRYAVWVVLCVVVVTALAMTVGPRSPGAEASYEASAVIVAQDLKIRPEGFPRFAEAVFGTGAVAERAVVLGDLPYTPDEIPDHAVLKPYENTVALQIIGRDQNPRLAADVANGVANAFKDELNKAGPGVGVFAVQDTARVPTRPVSSAQAPTTLILGVAVGLLLGVGMVALYSAVRRPVLTAADAAAITGGPVAASVVLPRSGLGRASIADPPLGVAAIARGLFPRPRGVAALVPVAGAERACSELAILTTSVLAARGATYLVAAGPLPPELDESPAVLVPGVPDVAGASPVLIDRPSEFDLVKLTPSGAALFLVVTAGTPRSAVRRAVDQFLPGELKGAVFVRRPRLSLSRSAQRRPDRAEATDVGVMHRRRAQLQEELDSMQAEIDRAGTTLRSLVREAQELRHRADQELEAELARRRAELVGEARGVVAPRTRAELVGEAPPPEVLRPAPPERDPTPRP
jgi:capsular polysaccharide biosynthesis protein